MNPMYRAEQMQRESFNKALMEHTGPMRTDNATAVVHPERTPQQLRDWADWAEQRADELQGEIERGEQPGFRSHEPDRLRRDAEHHRNLADQRESNQ